MPTKIATRRVDELGKIVLPPEAKASLALQEGDYLDVFCEENTVLLTKNRDQVFCSVCGAFSSSLAQIGKIRVCKACVEKTRRL